MLKMLFKSSAMIWAFHHVLRNANSNLSANTKGERSMHIMPMLIDVPKEYYQYGILS